MFFIFGSRNREKRLQVGQFYCPTCRQQRFYQHLRVSRYFTLYFIPIFPMNTLGEYLRCESCAGRFNPSVLQLNEAQIEDRLTPWKCPFCNNINPNDKPTCLSCQTPRLPASSQP